MLKLKKIVDTIENFGAAEKYLTFDADFEKFLRATYGKKELTSVDAYQLVSKYSLKGIVFGNYVTQEERYHFLYKISKQLEILAKIAGSNNLGRNVLIIAFGAQGKRGSLAHYNPSKQLINLNRGRKGKYEEVLMGEDSFVHEYAHFIDFMQGRKDQLISVNFANKYGGSKNGCNPDTFLYSSVIKNVFTNCKNYIDNLQGSKMAEYLLSDIEIFARMFESAFTYYVCDQHKDYAVFFDERKYSHSWYLDKKEVYKNGIEKQIIKILKSLK